MMDGKGEVYTDGPASMGSSLSPPFFLRLLFLGPLSFSSSDTGSQPGTYFFSGLSFSEGWFPWDFLARGIPRFFLRKEDRRERSSKVLALTMKMVPREHSTFWVWTSCPKVGARFCTSFLLFAIQELNVHKA